MITAQAMEDMQARGLHPRAAAREAGVSHQSIYRAMARHGVPLPRLQPGHVLRVDHREAVQGMRPLDAVEYLLDVIEAIVTPVPVDLAWDFRGVRMAPQEKRALRVLALSHGPVTRDTLYGALNGDRAGHPMEGTGKIVDVVLCRVRAKVAPFGVRIVTHYAIGWSVETPPGFVWPWVQA